MLRVQRIGQIAIMEDSLEFDNLPFDIVAVVIRTLNIAATTRCDSLLSVMIIEIYVLIYDDISGLD